MASWHLFGEDVATELKNLLPDFHRSNGLNEHFGEEARVLNGLSRLGWEAWNITETRNGHGRTERVISLRRPISGSVDHPDHRKA
jgi:hypothetical protein